MANQDEAERRREELIAKRAYEIHQARCGAHGSDQDDWLQAEREINALPPEDDLLPEPEAEEQHQDPSV